MFYTKIDSYIYIYIYIYIYDVFVVIIISIINTIVTIDFINVSCNGCIVIVFAWHHYIHTCLCLTFHDVICLFTANSLRNSLNLVCLVTLKRSQGQPLGPWVATVETSQKMASCFVSICGPWKLI